MSNDPTNNTDNNITIDELASRLIDRDIEMSEVPHELRTSVNARAAEFGTNRQQLLAALPHVDGSTINDAVQRAVVGGNFCGFLHPINKFCLRHAGSGEVDPSQIGGL